MRIKRLSLGRRQKFSLGLVAALALTVLGFQNCSGFSGMSGISSLSSMRLRGAADTQSLSLNAQTSVDPSQKKTAFDNVMFAFPLPSGSVTLTGLTGSAAIDSNGSAFEEALVTVGYTPSGQCLGNGAENTDGSAMINSMGGSKILYQFIIKSAQGQGHSEVSTNIAVPSESISGCAWVMLSGGLNALTMTSNISLSYNTVPVTSQPIHIGVGGEYCYNASFGCVLRTGSGSGAFAHVEKINQSGTIAGIFGSTSSADYKNVTGMAWGQTHKWYVDSQCKQFGSTGDYGPGDYNSQIPSDAVMIASVDISGSGGVMQQTLNQPTNIPVSAGDCIVHIDSASTNAMVDSEAQATAVITTGPQFNGNIDGINPNSDGYEIDGWACQIGEDSSMDIELYLGQNLGMDIGSFHADQDSEDGVAQACGANGTAYRFSIPVDWSFVNQYGGRLVSIKVIGTDGSQSAPINNSLSFRIPTSSTSASGGTASSPSGGSTGSSSGGSSGSLSAADQAAISAAAAAAVAQQSGNAQAAAAAQAAATAAQAASQATNAADAAAAQQQAAAAEQAAVDAALAARTRVAVDSWVSPVGNHLFAIDGQNAVSPWKLEGQVFSIYTAQYASTTALYRCQVGPHQMLSVDPNCEGQTVKGQLGYISTVHVKGTVPLYRVRAANGDYMESLDPNSGSTDGYTLDGPLGFVPN